MKVKSFIASPLVLTRPGEESPLFFYLSITNHDMSSVLIQDMHKVEMLVYFISNVFIGVETRYQKTEKLIVVVIMTRKL